MGSTHPNDKATSGASEGSRRDRGSPPPAPRWVKVWGIIFLVFVLLFAVVHLTGHGPGGHG